MRIISIGVPAAPLAANGAPSGETCEFYDEPSQQNYWAKRTV